MEGAVTIPALQQMKRDGRKIVGVVVYDYQMAQIVDRAGVDIVSVGDSVGINLWAQQSELEVTLEQMILAGRAVRRGVKRALVSCDFPYGPLQAGTEAAVGAAIRIVNETGADMVKLDGASAFPEAVRRSSGPECLSGRSSASRRATVLQSGGRQNVGPERVASEGPAPGRGKGHSRTLARPCSTSRTRDP